MKKISVLGSTGSIGKSTLDVVRLWPDRFRVHALAAGQNTSELALQIREFRPAYVAVATETALRRLEQSLADLSVPRSEWPFLAFGSQALVDAAVAPEVHFVLSAIVGVAGLEATYQAVLCRKQIGLANKEVLVAGGKLVMEAARTHGTQILPVDSEHNGVHQCLRSGKREEAVKLILTASGGPFRDMPRQQLSSVTPEQALRHPTWKMGPRITIDSATLMNKGFEVIEACWLFDFAHTDVEVVIHPQSTVHALVEFRDGSVLAQVCANDMRMPIQYALTYPERASAPVPRLSWKESRQWQFDPPDLEKFPLLKLAYDAQASGNSATCTLNAADEIAVEAFLNGQIPFTAIPAVVEETLNRMGNPGISSIGDVLEIDEKSRRTARENIQSLLTVQV